MLQNKQVLIIINQFYPVHKNGGPLLSISNLLSLGFNKVSFNVITQANTKSHNITGSWNEIRNFKVFISENYADLRRGIVSSDCNIYYLNSFFDFKCSIAVVVLLRLRLIPKAKIVLAPRGEFSTGALSIKTFKKRIFLLAAKCLNLYKNIVWHASTELEKAEIQSEFGNKAFVKIALDIPLRDLKIPSTIVQRKERNKLKIIFISRIVKKKNLSYVINTLNKVQGDFCLDIYGPIGDASYWQKCLDTIGTSIKEKIKYLGAVDNDKINTIFPKYDLFFFPTLGENFGHVIYESLALGVPVLCSDTTPWNKLEDYHAGWNIDLLEQSKFAEVIENLIALEEIEFEKLRRGCLDYSNDVRNDKKHIEDNLNLFEGL